MPVVLISAARSRDHLVHLAKAKAALARIFRHLVWVRVKVRVKVRP